MGGFLILLLSCVLVSLWVPRDPLHGNETLIGVTLGTRKETIWVFEQRGYEGGETFDLLTKEAKTAGAFSSQVLYDECDRKSE